MKRLDNGINVLDLTPEQRIWHGHKLCEECWNYQHTMCNIYGCHCWCKRVSNDRLANLAFDLNAYLNDNMRAPDELWKLARQLGDIVKTTQIEEQPK